MMKTSVTRKIDELGRIVIPSDFREALGVKAGEKNGGICGRRNTLL